MRVRNLFVAGLAMMVAQGAAAQTDSAAFIIRLGRDTTAIERYVRTPQQIVAEAVARSPNTMLHRLTLTLGVGGVVTAGEWTVHRPGEAQALSRRVIRFQRDSALIEITQGGNTTTQRVAVGSAIPIVGPFYLPYEMAMMRALAGGAAIDTVALLSGTARVPIRVQRVGRDSVALNNQFNEPMRAHIDARGRLLHLRTPAYATVERVGWIDVNRLASEFAARDASGRGLGMLSTRATTRYRVGGANLWLDYSRPAKRGRPVWGALVPWDQVWRMGANDAAHISTDRPLELGGVTLSPGTYTLFLRPSASAWHLIINRATGIGGLDYDAAQDVEHLPMRVETVDREVEAFTLELRSNANGGVLAVSWDRTMATIPFRVQ